jgi:putative transposase
MLTINWCYKIKLTHKQMITIEKTLETCRKVWNYALQERIDWLMSKKSSVNACSLISEYIIPIDIPYPDYHKQAKSLTTARKIYPQLKTVHSQILQQTLRRFDTVFENMRSSGMGFPKYRKMGSIKTLVFPQLSIDCLRGKWLKLPKIGWLKLILSRPIPDAFEIKQAKIIKKSSGYYVILSLQLDVKIPDLSPQGNPLGITLGEISDNYFIVTSDGEKIPQTPIHEKFNLKIKKLKHQLKRKNKNSANFLKLQKELVKIEERYHNSLKEFYLKLAHNLCDKAGMIYIEDKDNYHHFLNILSWICWKRGVYFAKVNSTYLYQVCPQCHLSLAKVYTKSL